jgi:hypothetical protein
MSHDNRLSQSRLCRRAFVVCLLSAAPLAAQSSDDPVSLFDGTLSGWTVENGSAEDFSVEGGVLRIDGREGWLRSERQYTDFVLRAEFRFLSADTDSGIFVRTPAQTEFIRGWPGDSYQIQLRDPAGQSPFPPVGGIFRHGTPPGDLDFDADEAARIAAPTGEWQVIEIELAGEELTVALNGTPLTRASNVIHRPGYIGIQAEAGTIEFRGIAIVER